GAVPSSRKSRSNISNNRISVPSHGVQVSAIDDDLDVNENEITTSDPGSVGIDVSSQRGVVTKTSSNIQNNRITSEGTGVQLFEVDGDIELSGNQVTSHGGNGISLG